MNHQHPSVTKHESEAPTARNKFVEESIRWCKYVIHEIVASAYWISLGKSSGLNKHEPNTRKLVHSIVQHFASEQSQYQQTWVLLINAVEQYSSRDSLLQLFYKFLTGQCNAELFWWFVSCMADVSVCIVQPTSSAQPIVTTSRLRPREEKKQSVVEYENQLQQQKVNESFVLHMRDEIAVQSKEHSVQQPKSLFVTGIGYRFEGISFNPTYDSHTTFDYNFTKSQVSNVAAGALTSSYNLFDAKLPNLFIPKYIRTSIAKKLIAEAIGCRIDDLHSDDNFDGLCGQILQAFCEEYCPNTIEPYINEIIRLDDIMLYLLTMKNTKIVPKPKINTLDVMAKAASNTNEVGTQKDELAQLKDSSTQAEPRVHKDDAWNDISEIKTEVKEKTAISRIEDARRRDPAAGSSQAGSPRSVDSPKRSPLGAANSPQWTTFSLQKLSPKSSRYHAASVTSINSTVVEHDTEVDPASPRDRAEHRKWISRRPTSPASAQRQKFSHVSPSVAGSSPIVRATETPIVASDLLYLTGIDIDDLELDNPAFEKELHKIIKSVVREFKFAHRSPPPSSTPTRVYTAP